MKDFTNDFIELDLSEDKLVKRKNKKEPRLGSLYEEPKIERPVDGIRPILEKFIYFTSLLIFMEITYHLWAFKSIDLNVFILLVLTLPISAFLSIFTSFFSRFINKLITWILTVVEIIYFIVNILYFSIFKVFFSIQLVEKTNMRFVQYYREIIEGIIKNWWIIFIVIAVPVTAMKLLVHFKVLLFERASFKKVYVNLLIFLVSIGLIFAVTPLYGKESFSPYEQLKYMNTSEVSVKKLGVLATAQIEIRNVMIPRDVLPEFDDEFFDDEEEEIAKSDIWVYDPELDSDNQTTEDIEEISETVEEIEEEPEVVVDRSPNVWDLDFEAMMAKETDEFVQGISNYLSTVEPTNKNEYTGMFEGFNLIFMTAEGFSTWAIDEKLTPTLYRLTHEGIICNNFYNPRTGGSTSDGEFVCSTSLYPVAGPAKNFKIVGQNQMPLALGNMFNMKYGITSRAYHDNDYEYYGRDISYPAMGYYYQGIGNGLEIEHHWPESDLQMMQATVDEYIDDDLFNVYYMTVSGHLNYNFSGNWCSKIHKDEVADLPYSEPCQAYIACQMEFDLALKYLIERLEEKGIADRTVICFTGDHWPYGLTNEEISEFMDHPVEENFELYKSSLILWSEAIKEPIYVDKVCGSMDIIPTLLNLFGFDYDSRLLMGRDIFSDDEGFVMFINRSFATDKVLYNSLTKEVTYLTDEVVDEDYITACRKKLSNKWKYSERIINYDYYKYVCEELGIEIPVVEQNYVPDYSKFQR